MKELREAVMEKLSELAEKGVEFSVLVSDSTSTSKIAPFMKSYPQRVVNVGIAEQNLVGMAAGLSLGGIPAITANAAPFLIARSNEQVKNDICYTNTNVKLIGLNPGFAYAALGPTHHALDDISIMRSLGNIQIFAPGDSLEAKAIIDYSIRYEGPVYIRLDSLKVSDIHDSSYSFTPGNYHVHREGKNLALLALGTSIHDALEAADRLNTKGLDIKVLGVPSIRPLDRKRLAEELKDVNAVVTVEEHSIHGGLGSLVSDTMMEHRVFKPLKKLGVPEGFFAPADPRDAIKKRYRLDVEGIISTIEGMLE